MTRFIRFVLLGLLLSPIILFGQGECSFKIDTTKILTKQNLGFFLFKLKSDSLQSFSDKYEIPSFIKKELSCLTNGFTIANPNEEYRCSCTSEQNLPKRKLVFLGKSKNILAMTYLTGGFGVSMHLLLIHFENNKIIDLWTGYCPSNLNNINSIIKHLKERNRKKSDYDTNLISI